MSNPNKIKGDTEERVVLALLRAAGFPHAERTRPGRMEDHGDIFVTRTLGMAPGVICQTKNVRTPRWSEWLAQLYDQKRRSGALVAFLTHKVGRPGKSPLRLAVMPLEDFLELLRAAGHGDAVDLGDRRGAAPAEPP